jgi:hypothetical protein
MRNRGEGATYVAVEARSERWREWHRPGRRSLARPVLRWPADPPAAGLRERQRGVHRGLPEAEARSRQTDRRRRACGKRGRQRGLRRGRRAGGARRGWRGKARWAHRPEGRRAYRGGHGGDGDGEVLATTYRQRFFFTAGRRGRRWSGRRSEARRQRGRAESEA